MDIKKYRDWIEQEKSESGLELINESKLSPYWKKRARERARKTGRPINNGIDRKWALEQQQKSASIDKDIHKIFEKELSDNDELSEEISAFLERMKQKREEVLKALEEKKKAALEKPTGKRKNKTLPNPYAGEKITKKFPYGGGADGGVAKVYKKRMRKANGATMAPGEGPLGGIREDKQSKIQGRQPTSSEIKDIFKRLGVIDSEYDEETEDDYETEDDREPSDTEEVNVEEMFSELSDVQKENFHKLLEEVPKFDMEGMTDKKEQILQFFKLDIEGVVEIVMECPSLINTKIKRPLFAGTQGLTFELENDHVLKLFIGGYQDDLAWYSSLKQKLYTSKGSVMQLPVYDSGDLDVINHKGRSIKFAEMAKLIPLSDFLEYTGRNADYGGVDLETINDYCADIYKRDGEESWEDFYKKFKKYAKQNEFDPLALTKNEIKNLALLIKDFIDRGNTPGDLHAGNIGILPQSDKGNPIFVIFDN